MTSPHRPDGQRAPRLPVVPECVVIAEGDRFRVIHKGTGDHATAKDEEHAHLAGIQLRVLAAWQRAFGCRPVRITSGGPS